MIVGITEIDRFAARFSDVQVGTDDIRRSGRDGRRQEIIGIIADIQLHAENVGKFLGIVWLYADKLTLRVLSGGRQR